MKNAKAKKKAAAAADLDARIYARILATAKLRGYKPAWAKHIFVWKFGRPPPNDVCF